MMSDLQDVGVQLRSRMLVQPRLFRSLRISNKQES